MKAQEFLVHPGDVDGEQNCQVGKLDMDAVGLLDDLSLVSVDQLEADMTILSIRQKRGLRVHGRVRALVTLECGVTLENFQQKLEENFDLSFLPQDLMPKLPENDGDIILDDIDGDLPELIGEEGVNLLAIVYDALVLAIPPYPRKSDAQFRDHIEDDEQPPSPFAVLKEKLAAK